MFQEISGALWREDLPHLLRRRRLTELTREFSALRGSVLWTSSHSDLCEILAIRYWLGASPLGYTLREIAPRGPGGESLSLMWRIKGPRRSKKTTRSKFTACSECTIAKWSAMVTPPLRMPFPITSAFIAFLRLVQLEGNQGRPAFSRALLKGGRYGKWWELGTWVRGTLSACGVQRHRPVIQVRPAPSSSPNHLS